MSTRDISNNVRAVKSLYPAARNATASGVGVDLFGYASAMVIFSFGVWTDGTHTPSLEESDDDNTYTAVSASDLIGSSNLVAVTSTATDELVQQVGYKGTKRYIRPKITVAGATTGALSDAVVVKGDPANLPAV